MKPKSYLKPDLVPTHRSAPILTPQPLKYQGMSRASFS